MKVFSIANLSRRGSAKSPRRGGFTLLEAALTTVIVGTGVLAIVAAQQAYHIKNDWAAHTTTGLLLANEIRELTLTMPLHDPITGTETLGAESGETSVALYNDVDDFAGTVSAGIGSGITFSPPINALRQTIPNLEQWSQEVQVTGVLPTNMNSEVAQTLGATDMLRVTVNVMYQSPGDAEPRTISTLTWVVTDK